MIHLAPFESETEHLAYCEAAGIPMEEGAVGFKVFSDEEKLGLFQIKFVGEAAYILNAVAIENKISVKMLANVFASVVEFLQRVQVASVIYPILCEDDAVLAEAVGFDKISDTLFVMEFPQQENAVCDHEHCSGDCHHCHG